MCRPNENPDQNLRNNAEQLRAQRIANLEERLRNLVQLEVNLARAQIGFGHIVNGFRPAALRPCLICHRDQCICVPNVQR